MKTKLTIGLRLSLWYLLMFACAQAVFGVGMWSILRFNLYDIADDALEQQVDDLQYFLKAHKAEAATSGLQIALDNAYPAEHSGEYMLVIDPHGTPLYTGRFAGKGISPSFDPGKLQDPIYEDWTVNHEPVRFLTEYVDVDGARYIVQVGVLEDDVIGTLTLFRVSLLLFAPFILLVAAAGGYWLSRRALAPLDVLTRTARSITGTNLSSRLEQLHTGDELQRMSDTLNDMLARIESEFLRVSQFTADASHELRTPVALIRTEAEIALRKSRDPLEYREALRHILLEAEKTSTLIETLLALARADAGRETLVMKPVDLRYIAQQAAAQWRPIMAAKNLQFTESLGNSAVHATGDEMALARLLSLLLDNAVKYTPSPGTIDIRLSQENHTATIKIRDTGIGIAEEDHRKIFERFYRVDKARTRDMGGAGLGLAIAEWIVQQHRGRVLLESVPGQGSTFTVELPAGTDSEPSSLQSAQYVGKA